MERLEALAKLLVTPERFGKVALQELFTGTELQAVKESEETEQ